MPMIITATDFSDVARNAINYACGIASLQKAEVVIIHSFVIPVMFSDIPMPTSLITDAQNDSEAEMKKLLTELSLTFPDVVMTGKVFYGDTIDTIDQFTSENKETFLVVIGNNNTGESNSWPDSTLTEALKMLQYPVLAVPPGIAYKQVRNICFAFDNKHERNDAALEQLKNIAVALQAGLHVLHINANAPAENEEVIDEHAKDLLSGANPVYHFVNDADDVNDAIQTFISDNEIDWLVMIPRKHSFFEGLFHKSHTKTIAHHIHIPILALHEIKG